MIEVDLGNSNNENFCHPFFHTYEYKSLHGSEFRKFRSKSALKKI